MIPLFRPKKCSCKRLHDYATPGYRICSDGNIWFECDGKKPDGTPCGSTLVSLNYMPEHVRKMRGVPAKRHI